MITDSSISIVHLNVSGREYKIKKSILSKIPYFFNMLETCNDNEIIFVDRSNIVFDHVVSFIIDEKHPYPIEYNYELDFYDIKYDAEKLYDPHKSLLEKYNAINNKLMSIANSSYNIHEKIVINGRDLRIHECKIKDCESKQLRSSKLCSKHNDDGQCIGNGHRVNRCPNLCNESFCKDHINKFNTCNKRGCGNIRINMEGSNYCFLHS